MSILPVRQEVLAAIDIGTNAARLELASIQADGVLHPLRQRRDPIRPGQGVFRTGRIAADVANRIISTLKEYSAICREQDAVVRAVATSSLRDALNGESVCARARDETGIDLEIIPGEEEARLICKAVLQGAKKSSRSLVLDIGGGSTEVIAASGDRPTALASLPLGCVRLTELYETADRVDPERFAAMRTHAAETVAMGLSGTDWRWTDTVYGSSGTIRSLAKFVRPRKSPAIGTGNLSRAVKALAHMSLRERRRHFDASRADVIVAGAVVLEALARELGIDSLVAVECSLRDGILLDLLERSG
jgi:exopolyphosphatase/guanosine-5'-triphosphate,3'-diphosphate pyrophosphatase